MGSVSGEHGWGQLGDESRADPRSNCATCIDRNSAGIDAISEKGR